MTQNQQKSKAKQDEVQQSNTNFEETNYQQVEAQSDLELEEQYLEKLISQRQRIEKLSKMHMDDQQRIQRQIQKNRLLREEIEKLAHMKEYQTRYTEVFSNFQKTTQQNKTLKEQLDDSKHRLYQSQSQKVNFIQKLKMEMAMQRDQEASRIEYLEDQINNKQEEIDILAKDHRNKQKQFQETISTLRTKINNIQHDHESVIKLQQRKVQRLERQLQSHHTESNEAKLNVDALLKENVQLKEEKFRLTGLLNSKDLELKSINEKGKVKWNSLKKELTTKEKECSDLKQSLRKFEKESQDHIKQAQTLRIQIRKIKDIYEGEKHKKDADFSKEKQSLQLVINQQACMIQEIENQKNYLLEENKRLQLILKKKENSEKHRKQLLKTQMKEIDKLEKVIDKMKIVD